MANLLELAKLSNAAYDTSMSRGAVLSGWSCTRIRPASGSLSGFRGAIFVKDGTKVVAFRGTAEAMDVVANLKLGTGMNSAYFDLGEQLASCASGSNVIVTGHSLGGAIAQVVANRCGYVMATFNAPGVGVIASRNILSSNPLMNVVRIGGMIQSAVLHHPIQALSDVANAFRSVQGINICLENDVVSRVGNHYGKVMRISGASINPLTEHGIKTVIEVLERTENAALAARSPSDF